VNRYAIVVLAPEETPEGRGRILHAFTTKRFDAAGASVALGVDFVGGADQHHSLAPLLLGDVTVSTF